MSDELVICVDDSPFDSEGSKCIAQVVKGCIYTVVYRDKHSVLLAELDPEPPYCGWRANRFRSVKRTSIEVFRGMLKKTPAREDA